MTSSHSRVAHPDDERVPGDAGVVDEEVDRAELLFDALDEAADLRVVGDVRLHRDAADLGGDCGGSLAYRAR